MQNAYRKPAKKGKRGVEVCVQIKIMRVGGGEGERALQMRQLPVRSLSPRRIRAGAQCRSRHSLGPAHCTVLDERMGKRKEGEMDFHISDQT